MMDLKLVLESIECALSHDESDRHISHIPIGIQCGHTVCKACIPLKTNDIKCNKCNEISHIDLNTNCKESIPAKSLIKVFANELLSLVNSNLLNYLNKLKDQQNIYEETINMKINLVKDQVDNRVKILKNELDKLQDELNLKLNEYKEIMLKEVKRDSIDWYELKSQALNEYLNSNTNCDIEAKIYEYQDELNKLKKHIDEIKLPEFKIQFNQSTFKQDLDVLGELSLKKIGPGKEEILYENKFTRNKVNETQKKVQVQENKTKIDLLTQLNAVIQDAKLKDQLKSRAHEEIDLQIQPTDICVLPDETLMVISWNNKCLIIYDKHFKQIKLIESIRKNTFRAFSACTNAVDTIYISDFENNRIIMTDLDFEFYKSAIVCPSIPGRPYGIRFYNDWLYVCDPNNKRVHKFNSNLVLHSYYTVETRPYQIQIYNDIVLLSSCTNQISFYTISTFDNIKTLDLHGGNICVVDAFFYEFTKKNTTFYVFDQNSNQIDEIHNDSFKALLSIDDFDGMTYFNGCFVLCSRQAKKLIVLKNYVYV